MVYHHNNDISKLKSVYAKSYNYVKYVVEKNQSHIRSFLEQVQSGCMKVGTKDDNKKPSLPLSMTAGLVVQHL